MSYGQGVSSVKHHGSSLSLGMMLLFLGYLFHATAQAVEPAKSPIRQVYLSLPEKVRDDPQRLLAESERMVGRGTSEVAALLLNGVARLATGDVEGFAERLARVKRLRFYKFEKPPLHSITHFVNEILNHIRDRDALLVKLARHPRRAFVHFQLGSLLLPLSAEAALPEFLRAVQIDPKYYDAWLRIAETYEAQMDWDRAEYAWERIVTLKPEDFRPFLKVAHMRLRRGDFAGAESWYHEGLRKKLYAANYEAFRETVASSIELIPSLREKREIELRKIQKFVEALKDSPADRELLHEVASAWLERLEDLKMAETWAHRLRNVDDADWRAAMLLYKIHARMGQNRQALDHLVVALAEAPERVRAAYRIELRRQVEKTLLEDLLAGRARIGEIVDYFAMYYE